MNVEGEGIRMPPSVWGPIFWNAMHIASLAYPVQPSEAEKAGAKQFYESLVSVLPCPVCREHYKQILKDSPLDEAVQSKGQLVYWVWDVHNRVNTQLGKPTVTIEDYLAHMRRLGSGTSRAAGIRVEMCAAVGVAGVVMGAAGFYLWRRLHG